MNSERMMTGSVLVHAPARTRRHALAHCSAGALPQHPSFFGASHSRGSAISLVTFIHEAVRTKEQDERWMSQVRYERNFVCEVLPCHLGGDATRRRPTLHRPNS
jgi:hypothetical protein